MMLGGNNSPRLPESLAAAGYASVRPINTCQCPLDGTGIMRAGLRSQRKLHHAFQELVRRQADEVHDELLGV